MDRAIVERAVRALAGIGAARQPEAEDVRPELDPQVAVSQEVRPALAEPESDGLAACRSPNCAGCYDVGDGRKIHPPKCGAGWLQ
jgi:hypothetical protein